MKRWILLCILFTFSLGTGFAQTEIPTTPRLQSQIGGRFMLDGITYLNASDTLNHQADITDVRLTAKATYGDWFMRLDVGFAGNRLSMKDTFLQYSRNGHYFRVGHMLNAFGIDPAVSTYDYQFINCANSTSLLYFGRHIGVAYIKSAQKYYFSANAFAGDQIGNLHRDLRQGYNLSMRGVWRPVMEETRLVQIGLSALYRQPDTDRKTGISNITLSGTGVTGLASPDYQFLSLDDARNQSQYNAEMLMVWDKWMFQGEYLATVINRKGARHYTAQGAYLQAGYMILGTGYGYDVSEAVPSAPLQPKSLQFLARYNFSLLNDPCTKLKGGNQVDISCGLAYQFNTHISSRLIYSYVDLDKDSPMGHRQLHMVQGRVAFWF